MKNIKTWRERADELGIGSCEARDEEITELRAKLASFYADCDEEIQRLQAVIDSSQAAKYRKQRDELRANLAAMANATAGSAPATKALDGQPGLTVRLTSFPESNGKRNWTALLVRVEKWDGLVGNCGGISLARGELWNRVAWEAECAKFLIGERDTEPCILDYGDDISTPEEWTGEVHSTRLNRRKASAPPCQIEFHTKSTSDENTISTS